MNIIKESKDTMNAVLRLKIEKNDYADRVDNLLKDYRRKAKIDGFRPGMAPVGMIKKMYGKHVLLDELNKIVSDGLSKYFVEEKLHLLGDPIPNMDNNSPLDLDNQEEFEFSFDIGLAPEFDLKIDKSLIYPYYKIQADEKVVEDQISRYASRYSTLIQTEDVSEKSILKGDLAQLDTAGNMPEFGIKKEKATLSPSVIQDENEKNKFLSAKLGTSIDFDIKKAFPNNTEISSMLSITKEAAESLSGSFRMTVTEITEYVPHEINEDLFKSVFGEDVTSEETFKVKIKEEIEEFYSKESDYKFLFDVKENMVKSINIELPETFLKRWLTSTNKDLTIEKVEKEFPLFTNDLKWQLIKDKISRDNEIKVSENEILDAAKESLLLQFKQYGINSIPEESLIKYAEESLKKDEQKQKFLEAKYENKVIDYIKNAVTLEQKEISLDGFNKLFAIDEVNEHNHEHEHTDDCEHTH